MTIYRMSHPLVEKGQRSEVKGQRLSVRPSFVVHLSFPMYKGFRIDIGKDSGEPLLLLHLVLQ